MAHCGYHLCFTSSRRTILIVMWMLCWFKFILQYQNSNFVPLAPRAADSLFCSIPIRNPRKVEIFLFHCLNIRLIISAVPTTGRSNMWAVYRRPERNHILMHHPAHQSVPPKLIRLTKPHLLGEILIARRQVAILRIRAVAICLCGFTDTFCQYSSKNLDSLSWRSCIQ